MMRNQDLAPKVHAVDSIAPSWQQAADVIFNLLVKKVGDRAHAEIVELGCGSGWMSAILLQLPNIRLTGVDRSSSELGLAREHYESARSRYVEADVLHYEHPNPVDVFCSLGLHRTVSKGESRKII